MIIAGVYVFFILEVLLHAWNSHSGHDVCRFNTNLEVSTLFLEPKGEA